MHHGAVPAGHLDDPGGKAEAPHRLGETVVVGEDDHLARAGHPVQDLGQPVHPGGVHGLDGIVDDHEAERALGHGRPRHEQAQRQAVQLALAHHPEGQRHPSDSDW